MRKVLKASKRQQRASQGSEIQHLKELKGNMWESLGAEGLGQAEVGTAEISGFWTEVMPQASSSPSSHRLPHSTHPQTLLASTVQCNSYLIFKQRRMHERQFDKLKQLLPDGQRQSGNSPASAGPSQLHQGCASPPEGMQGEPATLISTQNTTGTSAKVQATSAP